MALLLPSRVTDGDRAITREFSVVHETDGLTPQSVPTARCQAYTDARASRETVVESH